MKMNNIIARNWIVLLLMMWTVPAWAYFGMNDTGKSWGNNSVADNYYYGESQPFGGSDVELFTGTPSAFRAMTSTSSLGYKPGVINIAADGIVAGSTVTDFLNDGDRNGGTHGQEGHQWETDDEAPIGDGWDVMLLLVLLAVGYGVYKYRKRNFITL